MKNLKTSVLLDIKHNALSSLGDAFAFYSIDLNKELSNSSFEIYHITGTTPSGSGQVDIIDIGQGIDSLGNYNQIRKVQYFVIKNKSTTAGQTLFFDVNYDETPINVLFNASNDVLKIGPSGLVLYGNHLQTFDTSLTDRYFRIYSNLQAIPYELYIIGIRGE